MEIDSIDRISRLPVFILHDILSLLPIREAARTCVLSKQWNHNWESFPVSNFDQYIFTGLPLFLDGTSPECVRKIENFLNFVKRRILSDQWTCHEFRLQLSTADQKLTSKVDECLDLALKSGAISVSIMQSYLNKPVWDETSIIQNPLIKCCSVQELCLQWISLSEKSIHDIVHSCPNIRSLNIIIRGLGKVEINKLERLERISLDILGHYSFDIDTPNLPEFDDRLSIDIDAPNLREFSCDFGVWDIRVLDLTSCRGLRRLSLKSLKITDELFHSLISNFPSLEDLSIEMFVKLRRVTISAPCLQSLSVRNCFIEAIEIDAPVLSSLSFKAFARSNKAQIIPYSILKNARRVDIDLSLSKNPMDISRFVNLRKFLTTSTLVDELTVAVLTSQVTFDREELGRLVIPQPFQLNHLILEVSTVEQSLDKETLIDGLLWSFHLKKISVPEVLGETLWEIMKKDATCCGSSNVKCWRHYLKPAAKGGLNLDGRVICFDLDWDYSIF